MKRLWWLAILVPMWLTLVLCTHWEPVQRDGWGNVYWHHTTELTPATIWHFIYDESWLISNPRIGRLFTLLLYTPGPWSSIVTPLVVLGMFALLAAVVLGRWPSGRRTDDALLYLRRRGFPNEQALRLDRQHDRHRHQQRADRDRADAVPSPVVSHDR